MSTNKYKIATLDESIQNQIDCIDEFKSVNYLWEEDQVLINELEEMEEMLDGYLKEKVKRDEALEAKALFDFDSLSLSDKDKKTASEEFNQKYGAFLPKEVEQS